MINFGTGLILIYPLLKMTNEISTLVAPENGSSNIFSQTPKKLDSSIGIGLILETLKKFFLKKKIDGSIRILQVNEIISWPWSRTLKYSYFLRHFQTTQNVYLRLKLAQNVKFQSAIECVGVAVSIRGKKAAFSEHWQNWLENFYYR